MQGGRKTSAKAEPGSLLPSHNSVLLLNQSDKATLLFKRKKAGLKSGIFI